MTIVLYLVALHSHETIPHVGLLFPTERPTKRHLNSVRIRHAELTRDLIANLPLKFIYSSSLRDACEVAEIIAAPLALLPQAIELGSQPIRAVPDDESSGDKSQIDVPKLERLLMGHEGEVVLFVGEQEIVQLYLATLLGLPRSETWRICVDDLGVSVVARETDMTQVRTINHTFHLAGSPRLP